MAFIARVLEIDGHIGGVGNSQDYTLADFGNETPKAAIVMWSNGSYDGSVTSNISSGVSFVDSLNKATSYIAADDNLGTTNTFRQTATLSEIVFTSGSGSALGSYGVDLINNGVTLTVTSTVNLSKKITCILLGGSDLLNARARVWDDVGNSVGSKQDISTTFQPNLIFMTTVGNSLSFASNAIWSFGAATSINQHVVRYTSSDNVATTIASSEIRNDAIVGQLYNDANSWIGSLESFNTDGITIYTNQGGGDDIVYYLALELSANVNFTLIETSIPTSGNFVVSGAGFKPDIALNVFSGPSSSRNTISTSGTITTSYVASDDVTTVSQSISDVDNVGTTDCKSLSSDKLKILGASGSTSVEGDFSSFDSDGANYTLTTNPANELLGWSLLMGDGTGGGPEEYTGTATSANTSATATSGTKSTQSNVTSINTASTVKTGMALMFGVALSASVAATTTAGFKTELGQGSGTATSVNTASTVTTGDKQALGTATSANTALTLTTGEKHGYGIADSANTSTTITTGQALLLGSGTANSINAAETTATGDKQALGTAASVNTSATTTSGLVSVEGGGSVASNNTATTTTTGYKSAAGLISSVNGYQITLNSNAIMQGTAVSNNTATTNVLGESENDSSGTAASVNASQSTVTALKTALDSIESANSTTTITTATTQRYGTIQSANISATIVTGVNTAAPVLVRSVSISRELPYISIVRAFDNGYDMIINKEMMKAYQNNDIDIRVTVTENGEPVTMGSITAAEYRLTSKDKSQTLVTKAINNGISKGSDQLVIRLAQADTQNLIDVYYHELQITSDGKHGTVFSEHINFEDTVI